MCAVWLMHNVFEFPEKMLNIYDAKLYVDIESTHISPIIEIR